MVRERSSPALHRVLVELADMSSLERDEIMGLLDPLQRTQVQRLMSRHEDGVRPLSMETLLEAGISRWLATLAVSRSTEGAPITAETERVLRDFAGTLFALPADLPEAVSPSLVQRISSVFRRRPATS